MVLKDDYNKELFTIDEENLIYKGFFRKVKIKKSDIRSVFYGENILGILTYGGKIYSFNIVKLLYSERYKVENLRNELNKENIIFNYTKVDFSDYSIYFLIFMNPIINLIQNIFVGIITLIILLVFILLVKYYGNKVVFNIDKDELEVKRGKDIFKYKRDEIDKIRIIKHSTKGKSIEFKKNKNKYILNFEDTPYLIKNYNVSLNKLFNIV